MKTINKRLKPVNPEDVPAFQNEAEEADFWATHSFGEGFFTEERLSKALPFELPPVRIDRTKPIAIRFDQDVIKRLKVVANHKHKGYQTLLKEFVLERLYEEEKREKLVG